MRSAALRAELSPHLSEEQLDRLADVGAPVAADVTAHYVDVWNDGVRNAPATSAFGGPVLIIRGGADGFVTEQLVDAISPRFVEADVNSHRQGRSLGARRVPRVGRDDDPRLRRCGRGGDTVSRPLRAQALCHKADPAIGTRAATRRQHTDVVADHLHADHGTT